MVITDIGVLILIFFLVVLLLIQAGSFKSESIKISSKMLFLGGLVIFFFLSLIFANLSDIPFSTNNFPTNLIWIALISFTPILIAFGSINKKKRYFALSNDKKINAKSITRNISNYSKDLADYNLYCINCGQKHRKTDNYCETCSKSL